MAGIDPQIPLSVQLPNLANPLGIAQQIQSMRIQREQAAALEEERRAQAELRRQQTEASQHAAKVQAGSSRALQAGHGVRAQVIPWAAENEPDSVPWLTDFFDKSEKSAAEISKLENELNDARLNHIGHIADGILTRGVTPQNIQAGIALYKEQFPKEAQQADALGAQLLQAPPEQAQMFLESRRGAAPYWQAQQQKVAERGPVKVSPGDVVLGPDNKPVYTAPAAQPKPDMTPQAGIDAKTGKPAFQVYVPGPNGAPGTMQTVGGGSPVPPASITIQNQKDAADRAAASAPPPSPIRPTGAEATKINPTTGLSNGAEHQLALGFALEGKMPPMGMGSSPRAQNTRAAVENRAAAIADAAGVDLPTVRAEYAANKAALTKLLPQQKATAGYAQTALDNLDLAQQQSAKVDRTQAKFVNHYLQWADGNFTPASELAKYEVLIYTAAREYAKVTSGGAMSAQALSDSAAKEASKLLSASQSPEAFTAAVSAMKADMANVQKNQIQTIAGISSSIANLLAATTPQVGAAAPLKPTRIVYDINGNPVKK